jgi:PAS domain S-box-containing protein
MGAAGFERLLHPQDRDRLFQLYQAYHEDPAQNPIPPVLEYRLRHKNGEYRWFSDGFTIIKDGQGRDIAEVGTFRDVTDEKRTENALKESEARYRRITESVTDYIYTVWVKDGHAVETVHGAGCVAVTGYAPLDFWQNPQLWIGMVHPDDRLVVLQQTDDILSGRSYEHIEHRIVRKDGVTRWVRNTPVPCRNADGNLISYDGLISDITERKETEDALRESEERYRKVVEDAYDGICVIQDGVMRFVNPELAAILGYPLETMVGASFRQYVHPDTTEAVLRMYEAFLHGTKPPRAYEGLLRHRDGNPIEAEISGSRIVYEGRGAALITLRDVTERNKTQRLLAEQQRAVAAASRLWSLGMMAGGVAHEINNPLAIISGSAEQLRDLLAWEPVDRRRALDQAEKILRHTQRIAAIIKGLRAFAQDGSADPFKEVSLQSIVNEALDMCRGRFTAHNIRLTVAPIPEGLRLECRPTQLSQVLLNLLSNAHDAVEKLPDRWVDIQVEDSGEYIHLAVIDSGAGMVEEIREKALQPFFTTKTVGKGMGLGLSISLGIIQNHRGTLRIDAEGPNTRVVVRVPKRQPSWPTEGGGTDG